MKVDLRCPLAGQSDPALDGRPLARQVKFEALPGLEVQRDGPAGSQGRLAQTEWSAFTLDFIGATRGKTKRPSRSVFTEKASWIWGDTPWISSASA